MSKITAKETFFFQLHKRVKDLEDWKASACASTPDWQKVGEALDMKVGENVPKQLLFEIYKLKTEIEIWKMQAKVARYGVDCACEWKDGNVTNLCGPHWLTGDAMANARIKSQTDTLAEKYRKLTETRPPEGIQHPEWGYDEHGVWVRKP